MRDALRTCLLACGLVVLAAGCTDDGAADATVVDFWALGYEGEVVERLVPAFEARTPGVRVRVQQIPWSAAREKLITAFVAGTMPDVFQLGSTWVAEFVALGALEPLSTADVASAQGDGFFPGILEANVIDGTTWGLPWYVDTRVLFYRSDLLSRTGRRAPRTWDEWLDCMEAVRREASGDAFAILLPLTEWETPVILAMQSGATLLRDDETRGNFQSPEFRRAFTFYVSLFERGLAPRSGEASAANLYQGFADGTFSFLITGPWNLAQFRERLPASLQHAWATAPMPAPQADGFPGVSLAGGASLALWRGSRVKDAAWKWVQYLVAPEAQAELARLAGDLPARESAWRALALDRGAHTRAFWEQLRNVRPTPRIPEWERIAAEIGRRAEAAIRGEESVDRALAALDEGVDRILAKRRWLRERAARAAGAADAKRAPGADDAPDAALARHAAGAAITENAAGAAGGAP